MADNSRLHFHSIDALRFFAFFKVFIFHLPLAGNFPIFDFIRRGGGIGVEFFFVLSGFLITYILVYEKKKIGTLNLKRFFFRRTLRIWPLFYFMLFVAYSAPFILEKLGIVTSSAGYSPDWRFSFFFLENYKMMLTGSFPDISPLGVMWSLCIEEHFYILWSLLLTFIPYKKLPYLFLASVITANVVRFFFSINDVATTELFSNLDIFAIGGSLGYLTAVDYPKLFRYVLAIPNSLKISILAIIITVVLFEKEIFTGFLMQIIQPTVLAILFTILIAVFIPTDSKIKITSKVLNYLGSLSYGLYVYHTIFINLALLIYNRMGIELHNGWNAISFITITFAVTVVVSYFSYRFLELPFLRLKNVIKTIKLKAVVSKSV